jgi:hypothetical protein
MFKVREKRLSILKPYVALDHSMIIVLHDLLAWRGVWRGMASGVLDRPPAFLPGGSVVRCDTSVH